ncbi:MAG: fimbrial protein [Silanimonas sp.]|nr:MAG: fimbrial protein [Silanimonas sp.]
MARINLLPWRAERRKQRQKEFMTMLGGAFVAGVALVFLGSAYYNGHIDGQNARNALLQQEIAKVQAQIKEIEGLEAKKASLLQRKQVIEDLQAARSQNVKLFEELVRTIPDGVRLVSIKQNGAELTLNGRSQSESRVSAYMRNLEASGLITNPRLNVIRAGETKAEDRALPFEFEMRVALKSASESDAEAGAGAENQAPAPAAAQAS